MIFEAQHSRKGANDLPLLGKVKKIQRREQTTRHIYIDSRYTRGADSAFSSPPHPTRAAVCYTLNTSAGSESARAGETATHPLEQSRNRQAFIVSPGQLVRDRKHRFSRTWMVHVPVSTSAKPQLVKDTAVLSEIIITGSAYPRKERNRKIKHERPRDVPSRGWDNLSHEERAAAGVSRARPQRLPNRCDYSFLVRPWD